MTIRRYKNTSYKNAFYRRHLGTHCMNPECGKTFGVDTHHILPLARGGKDEYWNLINLCKACHRKSKKHSQHKEWDVELFTWKSYFELEQLGFVMDERDPNFQANFRTISRNI